MRVSDLSNRRWASAGRSLSLAPCPDVGAEMISRRGRDCISLDGSVRTLRESFGARSQFRQCRFSGQAALVSRILNLKVPVLLLRDGKPKREFGARVQHHGPQDIGIRA